MKFLYQNNFNLNPYFNMAYLDLKYLESVTGGDPEMIQEMKNIFISQVPEFIDNLKKYLREGQYIELGKEAHKAKTSVMIMGMNALGKDLKTLQLATISGTNVETYPEFVRRFEVQCLGAVEELKHWSPKLKK
jgi:HPt (histidine-containing phosphotransfer) domain-containing protein